VKARIGVVTAVVGVALAIGTAGGPAAAAGSHRQLPAWKRALMLRSRALDRRDALGSFAPIGRGLHLAAPGNAGWLRALQLRSQGLDRLHHLGSFALPPVM
jgi:hypothetical protein